MLPFKYGNGDIKNIGVRTDSERAQASGSPHV